MDAREVGYDDSRDMKLAQNWVRWQTLVLAVWNPRVLVPIQLWACICHFLRKTWELTAPHLTLTSPSCGYTQLLTQHMKVFCDSQTLNATSGRSCNKKHDTLAKFFSAVPFPDSYFHDNFGTCWQTNRTTWYVYVKQTETRVPSRFQEVSSDSQCFQLKELSTSTPLELSLILIACSVPDVCRRLECGQEELKHCLHVVSSSRMHGALSLWPPYAFITWWLSTGVKYISTFLMHLATFRYFLYTRTWDNWWILIRLRHMQINDQGSQPAR